MPLSRGVPYTHEEKDEGLEGFRIPQNGIFFVHINWQAEEEEELKNVSEVEPFCRRTPP